MKISAIQTKQSVAYDIKNPGPIDLDACKRLAAAEMDRVFLLMEQAVSGGGVA